MESEGRKPEQPLTLLYVEDSAAIRKLVSRLIEKAFSELTLVCAENGQQGLDLFQRHRPEIVLTDIQMPIMDGIRMARTIRELAPDCRIIVTSAHDETRFLLDAIDIGVNHYVLKPIDKGRLTGALEKTLATVRLERRVREQHEHIRKLSCAVEHCPSSIVITDTAGRVEYANPRFREVSGYSAAELADGSLSLFEVWREAAGNAAEPGRTIAAGQEWQGEFRTRRPDGEVSWETVSISPIFSDQGVITHYVAVTEDITERKRTAETIERMAFYDALTGLPNRRLFAERLHLALAAALRHGRRLAVLFLDLDRFKSVNDSLGHETGDRLLQAVAQRLRECCRREEDTIARQGGDEFTIMLSEVEAAADAERVAQKIVESFSRPLLLDGQEVFSSVSIGLSIFPDDALDQEDLLKNADLAMYQAKEQGRNTFRRYVPAIGSRTKERTALEQSLRRALERGELVIFYQPKVDLASGKVAGMEALVRWRHPERGLLLPAQFIPLAEETGLIASLGHWVLKAACAQNKAWQDAGLPPLQVAVNLSLRQFQQVHLVETVRQVLAETGLEPHWLVLELTESTIMNDLEEAVEILQRLNEMGVQIALDDFGTGYSSLSYLNKIPISSLKIDKSFIRDIDSSSDDATIARAVITLAHSLNLKVVAEGVESPSQLDFLRSLDCTQVQGFYFSRPVPADEVAGMLRQLVAQSQPPV